MGSLSPGRTSFGLLSNTKTGTVQKCPPSATVPLSEMTMLLGILLPKVTRHLSKILEWNLVLSVQITTKPRSPTACYNISRVWKSSGKTRNMT
jgi:hypothetical protein